MMFAITTLVMGGNNYVPGAIALAKSARLFSSARLVCMITEDVTDRHLLEEVWDEVVQVDLITVDPPPFGGKRAQDIYSSWISNAPTKWRCLGLDSYDKILFLDADMIIISPIDEIFTMNTPAAMFDHQTSSEYVRAGSKLQGFKNHYIPKGSKTMTHGMTIDKNVIEDLKNKKGQFSIHGGLALLEPNRIVLDMYIDRVDEIISALPDTTLSGVDEITIALFYNMYGYDWHHIDIGYNMPAYHLYARFKKRSKILHYVGEWKPWNEDEDTAKEYGHQELHSIWTRMYEGTYLPVKDALKDRIKNILEVLIGHESRNVVDKTWPIYQQAFTGQNINPVANYELLEAYGDRFLNGQYMWILLGTPGIITADQVSKISGYYQDVIRLTKILDYLKLAPYIIGDKRDAKVKSDVMEAFIAAVGISHDHITGDGDRAMRLMLKGLYNIIFKVNPQDYKILYDNPKSRMNELVQQLRLDRGKLLESKPVDTRGAVTITISYGKHLLGTGSASLHNVYRDNAIREARDNAYTDALDNQRLESYADTRV